MNNSIAEEISKGNLTLFLGAGASFGCLTSTGKQVPLGSELAEIIAQAASLEYQGESLDIVYEAAREQLGKRLDSTLENYFKHTTPSPEYNTISRHVWRRIYTLNIDDALDVALIRNSQQNINKVYAKDPIIDKDPFHKNLEYIKLNGSIERINEGLIFSPSESPRLPPATCLGTRSAHQTS